MDDTDERNFAWFGFKMSFGRISYFNGNPGVFLANPLGKINQGNWNQEHLSESVFINHRPQLYTIPDSNLMWRKMNSDVIILYQNWVCNVWWGFLKMQLSITHTPFLSAGWKNVAYFTIPLIQYHIITELLFEVPRTKCASSISTFACYQRESESSSV